MDVFVVRQSYEYIQLDTDSAHLSMAGTSLDNFIIEEKKHTYEKFIYGSCDDGISYYPTLDNTDYWMSRKFVLNIHVLMEEHLVHLNSTSLEAAS